jgi:NADPH:quinone reductase-like Zn-dependent oxidoreductase
MKRVQFNRYGQPAEMYVGDYELPPLKRDQVRVRVRAAAVNPLDWKQRQGAMKLFMSGGFPKGVGSDFAGVVDAVGEGVPNVRAGDEVFGTMNVKTPGGFAEALVTESSRVAKKPPQLSFAQAACLPIPAATAWAALLQQAKISPQSRVFINGCTGAVGSLAVQLALAHGARVMGSCSRASMPRARLAGVDPVFDYADEGAWAKAGTFDAIFDTSGTLNVGFALARLKPKGVLVDINPTPRRLLRGLFSRGYKLVFATMALKHLAEIGELAAKSTLKPAIDRETPFPAAVATITAVEEGLRTNGRVVITFPE